MKAKVLRECGIIFDDTDFDLINKFNWRIVQERYVKSTRELEPGWGRYLHQLLLGRAPEGYLIDHIDRNPSNNSRSNLRFVTPLESIKNTKTELERKLPLGVIKVGVKYVARVKTKGAMKHVGTFRTIEGAANAVLSFKEEEIKKLLGD